MTGEVPAAAPQPRRSVQQSPDAARTEGRFFERAEDGAEVELGRVTTWAPPDRIDLDFYPGTDADHPTLVSVRFSDEGDGTMVHVTHHPGPASVALWDERVGSYVRSWSLVLAAIEERT